MFSDGSLEILPFGRGLSSVSYSRHCSSIRSKPGVADASNRISHKELLVNRMHSNWMTTWWWWPPSWVEHLWRLYCMQPTSLAHQGLTPCKDCRNVFTLSHSLFIKSTFVNTEFIDVAAKNVLISQSTLYHVRWSRGHSSDVIIEGSLGVAIQMNNHKSSGCRMRDNAFYLSLMANSRHENLVVSRTKLYFCASYNSTFKTYNTPSVLNKLPPYFLRRLQAGGWCSIVQNNRNDKHCHSICNTSHLC
ncbi:uncharacterized protein LOC134196041 [Corticium candelabrum]|uniref:uncharacterized protein LOC134196041 n=1 Tax=Corticium candelabrum TaxID=121492 RepID=UPI002E258570|nr:uncharacterized protein LOC134196041 [Corticium candelabrum]